MIDIKTNDPSIDLAYKEGYRSRKTGKSITDNPYRKHFNLGHWTAWQAGWHDCSAHNHKTRATIEMARIAAGAPDL